MNINYSALSVILLLIVWGFWQDSGVVIYRLEGVSFYAAIGGMLLVLVGFIYCFKYTTSFSQWKGVARLGQWYRKKPAAY